MTEILMEKIEDSLHPVDADGQAAIRAMPDRSIVKVKFSVPRNVRQLRLFFAMINLVFDNQREPRRFATKDDLRAAVMIATGHFHEVKNLLHGTVHIIPNSISFGAMDDMAFREFFEAFKNLVFTKIIPGVGRRDFEQQIADMLRLPGPDQM